MIEELYKASEAGVQIDIIVRAVCSLVPGIPGRSENIRVRSILGRFLEHSRLYCFEIDDQKTYLLGSADLMPRNLEHRIEVVVPVEDTHARNELEGIFKALLSDNTHAWELRTDGTWHRVTAQKNERRRSCSGDVHAPSRPGPPVARPVDAGLTSCGIVTMAPCPSRSSMSVRTPSGCSSPGTGRELLSLRERLRLGESVERTRADPRGEARRAGRVRVGASPPRLAPRAHRRSRCS